MRSPQNREVDPAESQRLQARTDASAQDFVRQQRRYNLLTRKHPPLLALVRQSRDPPPKPLENLWRDANLANLLRLGFVNFALVPRPLHSDRSLRNRSPICSP